ncbi:hypothetical protein ICW40_14960 [Actinotalea ferrariae]|uniref:hypothetical protein n=1 Tax=Actinotalea ferrariae TaxID=1386098 RepID=UPI001C8BF737|nr:hypothetical protein [Actinotalea ferrariae]MBX9246100.1 hypothetical protein [Actinotalea ferrariae]
MRRSDELVAQARAVLAAERGRLRALDVPGELVLLGGASLPGTLTKGDVDLHLRVDPARFDAAVDALRGVYAVVHPDIWQPTLATFEVPGAPLPTGVAVTPVGGEHDVRFTLTWRRIAEDATLLAEYTALKADGAEAPGYEERKSAFFDRVVAG